MRIKGNMNKLLILFVVFFSVIPVSIGAEQNEDLIFPVNSKKDIEIQIAGLLQKELKINSNLKVMDNQSEDLRVAILFEEDKKKNLPKIAAFVDTKIWNIDKSGNITQVISLFSIGEVKVKTQHRLKLLEWANAWNNKALPIRIQIAKDNVVATINLVTSKSTPIQKKKVLQSFVNIIQVWAAIVNDLKNNELL
jgi:hypothetical protein